MSTAGKVLSVLVVLVAVVWVMLSATVAQLNRNGTQAVEALQKKVAALEVQVVDASRSLDQLKESTHLEQLKTQADLTTIQARQADVEKARSEVKEIASRVQLQIADVDAMVKNASTHQKQRETEKDVETRALAAAREHVETLKDQREEMVGRLTSLRGKLQATLQQNKALTDRLRKSSPSSPSALASPAALTR